MFTRALLCGLLSLMSCIVHAATIVVDATAHVDHQLRDESLLSKVTSTGNLAGIANTSEYWGLNGWFEWEVSIPNTGWYAWRNRFTLNPDQPLGGAHQYSIDGNLLLSPMPTYASSGRSLVGHVWITAGAHRFRISHWAWWGFQPLTGFELEPITTPSLATQLRISLDPGTAIMNGDTGAHFRRVGEAFNVHLHTAGSATGTLTLNTVAVASGAIVASQDVAITASSGATTRTVQVSAPAAGRYRLQVVFGGTVIAAPVNNLLPVEWIAIDTTPDTTPATLNLPARNLLATIACGTTAPDYTGGSPDTAFGARHRVVTASLGAYRETGNYGFLQYRNATDPDWFAYRLPAVDPAKTYLIEVDVPDDQARSMAIEVRQSQPIYHRQSGCLDLGREYQISNKLVTYQRLYFPHSNEQPRVVIMGTQSGWRGAAKEIRLYELGSLPPLPTPAASVSSRSIAFWYEEPYSFLGPYGANARNLTQFQLAADRWARTTRWYGADTLLCAGDTYLDHLYPASSHDLYGGNALTREDLLRMLLLTCERYGLKLRVELHPFRSELEAAFIRTGDPRRHYLMKRDGTINTTDDPFAPKFDPSDPTCAAWAEGLISEVARRYADSPAFAGVHLRALRWQNHSLNNWHNLDWGYGTGTATRFCAHRGISDPGTPQTRYDLFTGPAHRTAWLAWRQNITRDLERRLVVAAQGARADLQFGSLYNDADMFRNDQEAAYSGLPATLADGARPLLMHYRGGRKSLNLTDPNQAAGEWQRDREILQDPQYLGWLRAARSAGNGLNYLEDAGTTVPAADLGLTPGTPAGAPEGGNIWLSGHAHPQGRNANEFPARAVAETDARILSMGANVWWLPPLQFRHFAAAYRQLPEAAMPLAPGATIADPVVVRELRGTPSIISAVNRTDRRVPIDLTFDAATTLTSRVDGTTWVASAALRVRLVLEPFQLLALSHAGTSRIVSVRMVGATPAQNGLVAWWPLTDGNGLRAADRSGLGRHGTITGGIWNAGEPLRLDGVTSSVIADAETLADAGEITVAFHLKANALGYMIPISQAPDNGLPGTPGWQIKLRANGDAWVRLGCDADAQDAIASGVYQAGVWSHLTATISSSGTVRLFVNGAPVVMSTASGLSRAIASRRPLRIGCGPGGFERYAGQLRDVRVYRRVLSDGEIASLAGTASAAPKTNLTVSAARLVNGDVGSAPTFSVTVTNQGPATIPTGMPMDLDLWINGRRCGWASLATGIDVGGSANVTIEDIPWLAEAGTHDLTVRVNEDGIVDDDRDTDDSLTTSFTVSSSGTGSSTTGTGSTGSTSTGSTSTGSTSTGTSSSGSTSTTSGGSTTGSGSSGGATGATSDGSGDSGCGAAVLSVLLGSLTIVGCRRRIR